MCCVLDKIGTHRIYGLENNAILFFIFPKAREKWVSVLQGRNLGQWMREEIRAVMQGRDLGRIRRGGVQGSDATEGFG